MENYLETVFAFPNRLDIEGALIASRQLNDLPTNSESYIFDFSSISFFEPFGMLYFITQLRKFREQYPKSKFSAKNYDRHTYAAHMGFFRAFGLKHGNSPGEAPGSSHYVPISNLDLSNLDNEAKSKYEDKRETLERISHKLASVLIRENSGDLNETLTFSLREIFRNVFEHANISNLWYVAQHWPQRGVVEVCILDEGVGITKSLQKNPHLTVKSDIEALQLSLLPGISGVAYKGGPRQTNDPWANSGYGLFMTSQLCQKGGSFILISGNGGIRLEKNVQTNFECRFDGTAIRLQFNVEEIQSLSKSLEELRKKGSEIAGALRKNANITASMSSRMLSKNINFNN